MVEILFKDGRIEYVSKIVLKSVLMLHRDDIKSYRHISGTKSQLGLSGNYLKRGCLIR